MTETAYNTTTEPIDDSQASHGITRIHKCMKWLELLLSLVAFICEEIINTCTNCGGLYFFEFVSCSAVLISILFLIVYFSSPLRKKINIKSFKKIDFYITVIVGFFLVISSIAFVSTIDKTSLATTSVIFGFLAAMAFLAEGFLMWKGGYLTKEKGGPANGMTGAPEDAPLNTPADNA